MIESDVVTTIPEIMLVTSLSVLDVGQYTIGQTGVQAALEVQEIEDNGTRHPEQTPIVIKTPTTQNFNIILIWSTMTVTSTSLKTTKTMMIAMPRIMHAHCSSHENQKEYNRESEQIYYQEVS